jgi:LysM domain
MEYAEVTIHQPMRLETVARLASTELNVIKELNPALLRNFTPPTDGGFRLRLPVRSQSDFLAGYEQLPRSEKIKLSLHTVKKGELLAHVARKHNVTAKQLIQENGLRSGRVRPGQELIIVSNEVTNDSLAFKHPGSPSP